MLAIVLVLGKTTSFSAQEDENNHGRGDTKRVSKPVAFLLPFPRLSPVFFFLLSLAFTSSSVIMAPLLPSRSAALLALVGLSQAIEPPRVPHQPVGGGDRRLTFNETVVGPSLSPRSVSLTWSAAGEDGRYITSNDGGDLVLVDIVSGDEETFVTADALPA